MPKKQDLMAFLVEERDAVLALCEERDEAERSFNDLAQACDDRMRGFEKALEVFRKMNPGQTIERIFGADFTDVGRADSGMFKAGSDIDRAITEIQYARDEALHVDEILRRVEARTGRRIAKDSLVTQLARLAKSDVVVERTAPNTYRSRAWRIWKEKHRNRPGRATAGRKASGESSDPTKAQPRRKSRGKSGRP